MKPVKLKISWADLLGAKATDMTDVVRRDRWEQWKKLAIKNGDSDIVDFWTDGSACEGCMHKDGDWCRLQQLPVTVNPILTMGEGMIGMACMGAGKEVEGQIQMEFESNNLPF